MQVHVNMKSRDPCMLVTWSSARVSGNIVENWIEWHSHHDLLAIGHNNNVNHASKHPETATVDGYLLVKSAAWL